MKVIILLEQVTLVKFVLLPSEKSSLLQKEGFAPNGSNWELFSRFIVDPCQKELQVHGSNRKTVSEDIQEMPQSQGTDLLMYPKKEI